jgi:hypothetical protein
MPMPIGLSDEEFSLVTALAHPIPYASRGAFLRALVAELQAAGAHNPALVRKLGHRLQARYLGAAPLLGIEDHD